MNVLVTGAAGFLGYRLVERLVALGHKVTAVARSPLPMSLDANANLRWIERDLADDGIDEDELHDIDAVFHLAAVKELGAGQDETIFISTNEAITLKLARVSSRLAKKFIFASSQMVYGDPGHVAVTEQFPLRGMESSAYACSKLNAENWLRHMQKRFGGQYVSLRFCGFVEGGGNIDYMIDNALRNDAIVLFSNGDVCRDYLPAEKGVDAFIAALHYTSSPGFEVFNIGSGQAISSYDMAKLICSEFQSTSDIVLSSQAAPRANFVFDITKANTQLGFDPGSLAEAVRNYARQKKAAQQGR